MKATVSIANVYDDILKEYSKDLVVICDGKTHMGCLFFEKEEWDRIGEYIDTVDVDGSSIDVCLEAYKLLEKHNMLARDGKTLLTMFHWQWVNGLGEDPELCSGMYEYKNDTELLNNIESIVPVKYSDLC